MPALDASRVRCPLAVDTDSVPAFIVGSPRRVPRSARARYLVACVEAHPNPRKFSSDSAWRGVPSSDVRVFGFASDRGAVTWNYPLMLLGHPGAKADVMIRRYVGRALGTANPTTTVAVEAVKTAADAMGVELMDLEHTIWEVERNRSV